jgi:hypothetical protein
MNNTPSKWFSLSIITAFYLLVPLSQVASLEIGKSRTSMIRNSEGFFNAPEYSSDRIIIQKAKVFHNKEGLKDEIRIEGPLRELTVISKSKSETIDELIEQVSIWIPKMYSDCLLVNPRCIIILETRINEEERAEVRLGVAMKCTPKLRTPKSDYV